jgi:hypothetical protein
MGLSGEIRSDYRPKWQRKKRLVKKGRGSYK